MAMIIRGLQLHQGHKVSQSIQGVVAPIGFDTTIPLTFVDLPQSRQAVRCFFGLVGGESRLACLGVDFDVNILTRKPIWLATARWALNTNSKLVFDYYTQGWYT